MQLYIITSIITIGSVFLLFILLKRINDVVIRADVRPAAIQIIFVLLITPVVSMFILKANDFMKDNESIAKEKRAYSEFHTRYQTLLQALDNTSFQNLTIQQDKIDLLYLKKVDDFRTSILDYQSNYELKENIFSTILPQLTESIDFIEICILEYKYDPAYQKLKKAYDLIIQKRIAYIDSESERNELNKITFWLYIAMSAFIAVYVLAFGTWLSLLIIYRDTVLNSMLIQLNTTIKAFDIDDKLFVSKFESAIRQKSAFKRTWYLIFNATKINIFFEKQQRNAVLCSQLS
ncbi:hypothetical protein [Sulfuricurvum sp.]|uniref:hypothetical protein n=1 Tax=Sulfuricurvum sp. TaxID=2025608 RepID=UPI00262A3E41|nr:hypothetical protein [Sulfuricurvum sp.]MDD3598429.1 hypothetical protein [Sulfuricurvum sp.]